jgi:hypothetical protein
MLRKRAIRAGSGGIVGLALFDPAGRGGIVGLARFDPAGSIRRALPFPERRARLQIVHDELARLERIPAMGGTDHHQDDLVGRLQQPDPVEDHGIDHLPPRTRLRGNIEKRLLGHAGVVLEKQLENAAPLIHVPDRSNEAGNRPDRRAAETQPAQLRTGIEVLFLYAYGIAHRRLLFVDRQAATHSTRSASGNRRKKRDFLPFGERRRGFGHALRHCDPDRPAGGKLLSPDAAPPGQPPAKGPRGFNARWKIDLLDVDSERLSQRGKVSDLNHHPINSEKGRNRTRSPR